MTALKPIRTAKAAFTIVELLMGLTLLGVFTGALLATWTSVGYSALNSTAYARRQNDQMRVLDYLKRDIRRATQIELYNGATLVTGTKVPASELKLTMPDYYADTRQEDDFLGPKTTNSPTVAGDTVNYGAPLVVRYFVTGGAAIRKEQALSRTLASAAGAFSYSFMRETDGSIRCRVSFDQPMRGGSRTLHREAEVICLARSELRR